MLIKFCIKTNRLSSFYIWNFDDYNNIIIMQLFPQVSQDHIVLLNPKWLWLLKIKKSECNASVDECLLLLNVICIGMSYKKISYFILTLSQAFPIVNFHWRKNQVSIGRNWLSLFTINTWPCTTTIHQAVCLCR